MAYLRLLEEPSSNIKRKDGRLFVFSLFHFRRLDEIAVGNTKDTYWDTTSSDFGNCVWAECMPGS